METNQLQQNENDEVEINLAELLYVLLNKLWVIILAGVVCAGISGVWTKTMITPQYQSTSMLYILSQSTSITSLADIQVGSQLAEDYKILIKSRPVINEVIENLDLNLSYEEVVSKLAIIKQSDTRIIKITVTDADPEMAKAIADEVAQVGKKQMAHIMKTDEPSIVENGYVNQTPSSPSLKKNSVIAGLAGVAVAISIILLVYLLNDSIRSAEDIEKYLGLTTLGIIPLEDGQISKKKKKRRNEYR